MPIFIALFIAAILFSINPVTRFINRKRAEATNMKIKAAKKEAEKRKEHIKILKDPFALKLQQEINRSMYGNALGDFGQSIGVFGQAVRPPIQPEASEIYNLKMEVVDLKRKINYDENLRGMMHDLDTESVRLKLEVQDLEKENKTFKDQQTRIMRSELAMQAEILKLKEDLKNLNILYGTLFESQVEGVIVPRELSDADIKEIGDIFGCDEGEVNLCFWPLLLEYFTKQETPINDAESVGIQLKKAFMEETPKEND